MTAPPLWNRLAGPIDDTSAATIHLLGALDVAAAPRTIAAYVTSHPAYPSLAAVVDCLAELGVRTTARRMDLDGLAAAPTPALIHVRGGTPSKSVSAFWVVTEATPDGATFECLLPDGERRRLTRDELGARFQGIVLTPSAHDGSAAGERYAARNALGDRLRALLPGAAVALFVVAAFGSTAAALLAPPELVRASLSYTLIGWVGLAVSLFLSFHEVLGARSSPDGSAWLGRLCPSGKRFNCAAVLGSKGGQFAGVVPLADLAAAFFLAQALAGTAAALSGCTRAFLFAGAALGVLLVPAVAYSLFQQARVIRRWCALCLLVDGVLAVQIVVAALAPGATARSLDLRAAIVLSAASLCATLAYAIVRPLVTPAIAAPHVHHALDTLRGSPGVLAAALDHVQPLATALPGKLPSGDPTTPIEVLLVSHPFCVACADAHRALHRLVEAFPDLVHGATVFSVTDGDAAAGSAARRLLAGDENLLEWYAGVDYKAEAWVRRDDHATIAPALAAALAAQTAFAQRAGVTGTPAVFVAGRPLPPGFGLNHVRFYLRALKRRRAHGVPTRETA